ncbi:PH domain-containing protein [Lipingzhangella sp. LS1_29]|uniref:PH domain-containing protein n=1 Tax=Lipingzhangella rawalii TaxID=2055835 RepID=A0ABU2HA80_9ACTN|nr:PH domain-containing protein [Lipingzhangella rawalii]MDS1271922.1 PH domain-containing protein [Lipingzhangella rawalii]
MPGPPAERGGGEPGPEGPHQLHWLTVPLRVLLVTTVMFAVVGVLLLELEPDLGPVLTMAVTLLFIGATGAVCLADWWTHTYELSGDHLLLRRGLVHHVEREVPLSRLQTVDTVCPLLVRVLGLAEVRIELAGGDRSEVRLAYLSRYEADRLRSALIAHAAGLPGGTPPPEDRPLFVLGTPMLLTALVAQLPVLVAFGGLLVLAVVGLAFREPAVLGAVIPLALGLIRGFLGPLLRYGGFRAAVAPDGLRLRFGLVQRRDQTVPPGRVHAVRVVEPLLWQLLGLARLDANIAGHVGERQMDSATLLPVVPRRLAFELTHHLLPGVDPGRAQLVPARGLRGRTAELGVTETALVARSGVLCRTAVIVAHSAVQSIRLASGPVERWLGRVSLVVETVPGPVRLHAPARGVREGWRVLARVSSGVDRGRMRGHGPERWVTRTDRWPVRN